MQTLETRHALSLVLRVMMQTLEMMQTMEMMLTMLPAVPEQVQVPVPVTVPVPVPVPVPVALLMMLLMTQTMLQGILTAMMPVTNECTLDAKPVCCCMSP
jgi:hypothetical protein